MRQSSVWFVFEVYHLAGCDHEGVVGAVDGDGDDPAGGAIARDRGEAVGERLAGGELLDRGQAVVGRMGPRAVGRVREGAEAIAAGLSGSRRKMWLAGMAVSEGLRSVGVRGASEDIEVVVKVNRAHAADYGDVVGAVDGDGDDPAGSAIARDRGEAVGERLAGTELLD